jgi:hypothetical protein
MLSLSYCHSCACAPGGEEDIQNSLQEKAIAAGGFSAPAAALGLGELGVGTPAGWLYRGLLLQVGIPQYCSTTVLRLHDPEPCWHTVCDGVCVMGQLAVGPAVSDRVCVAASKLRDVAHMMHQPSTCRAVLLCGVGGPLMYCAVVLMLPSGPVAGSVGW